MSTAMETEQLFAAASEAVDELLSSSSLDHAECMSVAEAYGTLQATQAQFMHRISTEESL